MGSDRVLSLTLEEKKFVSNCGKPFRDTNDHIINIVIIFLTLKLVININPTKHFLINFNSIVHLKSSIAKPTTLRKQLNVKAIRSSYIKPILN